MWLGIDIFLLHFYCFTQLRSLRKRNCACRISQVVYLIDRDKNQSKAKAQIPGVAF